VGQFPFEMLFLNARLGSDIHLAFLIPQLAAALKKVEVLAAENEELAEEGTRVSKLEREIKVLKGKNAVLLKDVRALEVRWSFEAIRVDPRRIRGLTQPFSIDRASGGKGQAERRGGHPDGGTRERGASALCGKHGAE
jgi:hypothetical protein